MRERDPDTQIAALKAIVQTLVLEHYWAEDEAQAKRRFLAMAEADHPLAMAVVNELTAEQLDAAFRWPRGAVGGEDTGPPSTPVMAFLTEEQYERVRVTTVAENEGDRVRERAMHEPGGFAARTLSAGERIRVAERAFVAAMVRDLAEHRGVTPDTRTKASAEEAIAAMPEPWRSRTRRELERMREDFGAMLAEPGENGTPNGSNANAATGPAAGSRTGAGAE